VSHERTRILHEYAVRDSDRRLRDRYRFTNPGHLFLMQQRERRVLALLTRHGFVERLGGARILEVGCGTGGLLVDMLRYGARADYLAGIDLVADRITLARSRLPQADLRCADAEALPYPDRTFDLVCQMGVLTTILDGATRERVAAEMVRVTKADGLLLSWDLRRNSPGNRGVRAIGRAELAALFPQCGIQASSIMLAAPLARLVAPRSWLLAELLERLPPLRTHLVAAIRPVPSPAM
jgi:SAM-dependent methyltransferase